MWTVSNEEVDETAPLVEWWKEFNDPLLNKYIAMAAEYNNDVLEAESNILQARALRQMAASSFYPKIGADVNATRTYFSKNGPLFAIGPSVGSVPGTTSTLSGLPFDLQVPQTQNLYNALFDASWEIDLFGKTRRTVEAADALIGRSIEEKNDTLLSVMAEIARNYIELRSFQRQESLLKENIDLLEKKSALVHRQFKAGYVNGLDEENIQAALSLEKAKLPNVLAQLHQRIFTLSVLIGEVPETLFNELNVPQSLPEIPKVVAVGLRSDLLRRRPDIRAQERNLAAATANIGVAVAEFFPTFTLVGDGGLQSLMLKNLFSLASKTWALGGDLSMPIFQGGKLSGNLNAKRAETAAVAYRYQQTVLRALEETESALLTYTQSLSALQDRKNASENYNRLVFLSTQRNAKGLTNLLDLIDSKRQYNESEQTVLEGDTATLLSLVSLYKALGGGWETVCTSEE